MDFKNKAIIALCLLIAGCVTTKMIIKPVVPELIFTPSVTELEPGHSIDLIIVSDYEGLTLTATGWWEGALKLTPIEENAKQYERYVTVPLDLIPGMYTVTITAYSNEKALAQISESIHVLKRSPFKISRLSIKSFGKYDFAPESAIMSKARVAAGKITTMRPSIKDFIWPVKGRLSEQFGVKRIYNNGLDSWYHGGLDIAAPGGKIIVAPADGRVILSRDFTAHGKAILIDHGFGVVTTFLHQSKRLVETGDVVKKGQPIGHVGTTGSSTGNHLHFQVNINNIISNPYDFLKTDMQN